MQSFALFYTFFMFCTVEVFSHKEQEGRRPSLRTYLAFPCVPSLAAPEAHRARRLALRHALHSALGLRPRRGALRLLRSSLRSPNLIAFGDRRILPSLRSALAALGGYHAPRHDLTWGA